MKNVGITSTIRGLLTHKPWDKSLDNTGWTSIKETNESGPFSYCIPLKFFLPIFEHYKKVILNQKQELVILLASSRNNCIMGTDDTSTYKMELSDLQWRVPHLKIDAYQKLNLLKIIENDRPLEIAYRAWENYEFPTLPETTKITWTLKTTSALETPRYVIVAFQTGKKNKVKANASLFDGCNLSELKVYLNDRAFPYLNLRGEKSTMYELYARFRASYMQESDSFPLMSRSEFDSNPIYVIDTSHQELSVKSSTIDLRIEMESKSSFPKDTTAYCIVINDIVATYQPLTGIVTRKQ
ncbi:hypothetical protein GE061_007742 [Apolygus lucorum]|uniref:Double jelly roll-like domain-containing protein n=1 Tax=Apolygus lucorum TaxID=248454 RepID=A0A8S9WMK5_APOLU|nr:hypothetical protein GE061_007742 [Apolygus lucorum]